MALSPSSMTSSGRLAWVRRRLLGAGALKMVD